MRATSSLFAISIYSLLLLVGCGHGHGHGHGDHAHSEPEAHTSPPDPVSGPRLTLNNGEKWQVDPPTRESAARLAALAADTEAINRVEDARTLGQALDAELDTLVRGCKMTGPAHDQLHVFLLALFPQVQALQEKTAIEDLRSAREQIGDLLEAYASHFE